MWAIETTCKATMDPRQAQCFVVAQKELQDLFREISVHGRVGSDELQQALLPFTAGDAKRDLLELIRDLSRCRTSLDEHEFVHELWKKMYLNNVTMPSVDLSGQRNHNGDPTNGLCSAFTVPLTHVIVSIKRRSQLHKFASYYTNRGISGTDSLTATKTPIAASAQSLPPAGQKSARQRAQLRSGNVPQSQPGTVSTISIQALRQRTVKSLDVVACAFDAESRVMKAHRLFNKFVRSFIAVFAWILGVLTCCSLRTARVVCCSRLYCLLLTKDSGNFVIGSSSFARDLRRSFQRSVLIDGAPSPVFATRAWEPPFCLDIDDQSTIAGLLVANMEAYVPLNSSLSNILAHMQCRLGLHNVVTAVARPGTFIAFTERKVHEWNMVDDGPAKGNSTDSILTQQHKVEAEGDCFGLVSGATLVGRSKTIADVMGVKQAVVGDQFTMGLAHNGDLFAWGAGPLGRDRSSPEKLSLAFISRSERIRRIACGRNHVLVLTNSGTVYSWGSNVYGQLGHGSPSLSDTLVVEPKPVPLFANPSSALDVASGYDHSVVLTSDGQVSAFGNDWHGQLGVDPSTVDPDGSLYEPRTLQLPTCGDRPSRAYLITAHGWTTAAVTDHGEVFVWGICIPSGVASVCGLVSRSEPQRLEALDDLPCPESPEMPVWQSLAVANGLVLLARHSAT